MVVLSSCVRIPTGIGLKSPFNLYSIFLALPNINYIKGFIITPMSIKNRTIFCHDNIDILQNMEDESIDLIYLDPPFNKKKTFHAPLGSRAEGASFRDTWYDEDIKKGYLTLIADLYPTLYEYLKGVEQIESRSHRNYLIYMAQRLIEMKRILKDTGSVYLHCDNTMSHYLKLLMDCVFGYKHFIGHIVWKRHTSLQKGSQYKSKTWGTTNDDIFHYVKSNEYIFNDTRVLTPQEIEEKFPHIDDETGERFYDDTSHLFRSQDMGDRPNLCYEWRGFKSPYSSGWRLSIQRLEEEHQKGNIVIKSNGKLQRRKYLKDYKGVPLGNLWTDINPPKKQERVGYPTQKPIALLERIIQASSNKGDMVLDPFCGCATTCVAAEKLGRQWIGIDVSKKAYDLVKIRLDKEVTDKRNLFKYKNRVIYREDIPQRSDIKRIDLSYGKHRIEAKHLLYEQQEGICKGCQATFEYRHFDIDHIVPQAKGGGDNIENLQLLCSHCNRIKGQKDMSYLVQRLQELGIL